jgi:Predicted membrane protein (DUF2079)
VSDVGLSAAGLARRRRSSSGAAAVRLAQVRRVGLAILAVQLIAFFLWSTVLYRRFALTFDYAVFDQAWWEIAHGKLDPVTLEGFPYWRDHGDLMAWLLAPLYWLFPSGIALLLLQDMCVVVAEATAFLWLCDSAARDRDGTDGAWLAATGLVLLVANPWIWWAISFDFHIEAVALLFVTLVIRDLAYARRRAWIWVIPLILCGDVAGTYLVGAGLGGMLANRQARRSGALMACLGLSAVGFITLVHANIGSGLSAYAYLAAAAPGSAPLGLAALARGVASHPIEVLRTLWSKHADVLASLSPSGLLGLADPALLPLVIIVVLANNLFHGLSFAAPIFQYLPVYILLPVGTVLILARLTRRSRPLALALCAILVAQALGWAAAWGPRTSVQWLRVSAPAAATLTKVADLIPASASVIASQGVVGRFAGRVHVNFLNAAGPMPVDGETWFVLAPTQGIEILSPASTIALVQELAGPLHATMLADSHGIWAFKWDPPAGVRSIVIPSSRAPLAAWATPPAPGSAGRVVLSGPEAGSWHVASTGRAGYVDDELAWRVPTGIYQAVVRLSASGPVNLEVWNDNGNVLLTRRTIPATNGVEAFALPVDALVGYRDPTYRGWGPFEANFSPAPPGQRIEIRVWSPGGETVNVYRASLTRAG